MSVTVGQIISAIEAVAPRTLSEEWDNCGLLVGSASAACSGVIVALDVTPSVVAQARARGCNLILAHHPVIFKGVKAINGTTPQGSAIIAAIKSDIAVYCAHTSLDNAPAPYGVSCRMAELMTGNVVGVLSASGTGVMATLDAPMAPEAFMNRCKEAFGASGLRHSQVPAGGLIAKVAFGGGACGFLIPDAIEAGADAIVTSDVRYHDFLDYGHRIFIIDLSHFDTEKCTKEIFKRIISQNFPNFAPVFCADETNPIEYL